jgi:hypothetical protein
VQIIAVVAVAMIAPDVHALSGRAPTARHPDVFVRSPIEWTTLVGLGVGGINVAVGAAIVTVGDMAVGVAETAICVSAIVAVAARALASGDGVGVVVAEQPTRIMAQRSVST